MNLYSANEGLTINAKRRNLLLYNFGETPNEMTSSKNVFQFFLRLKSFEKATLKMKSKGREAVKRANFT